ncbi:aldo/keto reductase (plasmid) [Agrobacterium rosae]|uniref:Aldo/keto reductase n=1 Tax=Agrobacterium rosae TaxID=1972867 RepID=A0ABU4W4W2_9HYPH|nr:aldo/keto reductase [Agrobacterium rosae]MDX8331800.1 aldo/keto reductase [Agrobacterium rosae]
MSNSIIPAIGLGTYGRTGDEGLAALLSAIEIGYRHLDTAQSYGTEVTVGHAVAASGQARDEFFITTKVADTNLSRASFMPSVEKSLETLGLDRVDLLLIHWPTTEEIVPFEDYVTALGEARERGFTRLIGVSNFPIALLERASNILGQGQLATNQIEIHPYLQSPLIRDYARQVGLQLTAYMPLAKGAVTDDPVLAAIAEKHGVTTATVSLAFLMAEGHVVIPSSANTQRLKDNWAAGGITLSADEMERIRRVDRANRMINPAKSPAWDD